MKVKEVCCGQVQFMKIYIASLEHLNTNHYD